MVLENFKSYAGEQRVGPFHKVVTFLTDFCACGEAFASYALSTQVYLYRSDVMAARMKKEH